MKKLMIAIVVLSLAALAAHTVLAQSADPKMSFFLTSKGPGDGANLGGLDGADRHCAMLAEAAGVTGKTWRAYLSTTGSGGVNAKDRIGSGPWFNSKGVQVAANVTDLHSDNNKLSKENSISEKGEPINGRGDDPNRHDILTGTQMDGTAMAGDEDTTCGNWTNNGDGSALVGHHDRTGGGENPTSWNHAHGSRGCGQADLQGTGGDGLFYCFAINSCDTAVEPHGPFQASVAHSRQACAKRPDHSKSSFGFARHHLDAGCVIVRARYSCLYPVRIFC